MAGSIKVAGHTIAQHDIVNDKVDIKNATLDENGQLTNVVWPTPPDAV